jgi:hypothetical protein
VSISHHDSEAASDEAKRVLTPEESAVGLESPVVDERPDGSVDPDMIRLHLKKVLLSPAFRTSPRCQTFLAHLIQKSLDGQAGSLKERALAVDVFGRCAEANLAEDTIVRVSAREVRRRLAQYYATAEAAGDEVRIDLPTGSYVPVVQMMAERGTDASSSPAAMASARFSWASPFAAGTVVAVLGALAYVAAAPLRGVSSLDAFWNPVLGAAKTVLIVVGTPIVYHPSERAQRLSDASLGFPPPLLQAPIDVPPEKLDGSDMIAVLDKHVGVGNLLASTDLVDFFARHNRTARVRIANRVEFIDLGESPVILIGAFSNRWTIELNPHMHFRFGWAPGRIPEIVEAGGERHWALPSVPPANGTSDDDFILVSRILDSSVRQPTLVVAGLKQFGTGAAGHLVVDPAQLGAVASQLPPGWQTKSLQLVLHARVIGNGPTAPELVASYAW